MKQVITLLLLSFFFTAGFGQLGLSTSTTDNTLCSGNPCEYSGPTILINELMIAPTIGDGSLSGPSGTNPGRGEWIELYNPNLCEPVNISCYYLGNNAQDGGFFGQNFPGGFVLPQGTIVPPAGFAVVRGVNATPVPPALLIQNGGNVVEIIVPANVTDPGVCVGGGTRLWFPNAGGWFAFYDANGVPQDAVSWGSQANVAQTPCVPAQAGCSFSGSLPSFNNIPANRRTFVTATAAGGANADLTMRRTVDGGAWAPGYGFASYGACNGPCATPLSSTCNGTATVTIAGGTPPYTFFWNDSEAQLTQTATGLCEGFYCVIVTDATGLSEQICVQVNNISLEVNATFTDVSCFGASDGSVTATVTGGAAPFTYSWSNGANNTVSASTNTISGLSPNIYSVFVQDVEGCSNIDSATVTVSGPSQITLNITVNDETCFGETNGSIQVTASGGVGGYQYSLDNVTFSAGNLFQNLSSGNYTVYVRDADLCQVTQNVTVDGPDSLFLINVQSSNVTCFGLNNGSISFNAQGGSPNYSFSIDGGLNFGTQNNFTNLAPGSYNLLVSDGNNCLSNTVNIVITEPAQLEAEIDQTVNVLCNGNSTGAVTTIISGGTLPYTFNWNSGAFNTQNIQNLPAGTYNLTVTDNNGCTANTGTTITQPDLLTANVVNVQNVLCFGNANGSFEVNAQGGVLPYSYSFNGGVAQTSNVFSGLNGVSGNVVVTDNNGCTVTQNVTITEPAQLLLTNLQFTNITCNGANNGAISFSAQGGITPYSFSIDGGNNYGTQTSFNALSEGTYRIVVRDANNCFSDTSVVTITNPALLTASVSSVTNVLCNGNASGAISISVAGGTPTYTYSWSNGVNTQNLSNVVAGSYTVTVTDANLCTATASATITQPSALSLSLTPTNISCNGGSNGAISSIVSGGVSPYTYLWNTGASNANLSNLPAGNYSLTVTDANGCNINQSVTLTQPQPLVLNMTSSPVICFGGNTGSANVSVISGGTAPFSFQWNAAAGNQTTANANNLSVGTYVVTVTDANGCIQTGSISVSQPPLLEIVSVETSNPNCFGSNDGSATVLATGGINPLTYSLTLPNGSTSSNSTGQFPTGLIAGNYNITVADANGCTTTSNFVLTNPPEFSLIITDFANPTCFGFQNGQIQVAAFNGVEPYIFTLGDGTQAVSNTFVVGSGIYNVTVTDANGCTVSQSQIITDPAPVRVDILSDSNFVEMGEPLQLTAATQNTTGQVVYTWTPTEGLSCADCQNPLVIIYDEEEFTVSITDSLGCRDEASLFIEVSQQLYYFIPNAFTPGNIDGTNDDFRVYGQNIKFVEMIIFNRWGEKVFESASPFVVWDGTFKGQLQSPGVYTYYTKITFLNNRVREAKGSVTLLR